MGAASIESRQLSVESAFDHPEPRRPTALVPLYVAFAGMQALDVHSTFHAVRQGGREMNPVVNRLIDSPAALVAAKAGAAAGTIVVVEKLWKRHPVAAIAAMVALNSAYAVVVSQNYAR